MVSKLIDISDLITKINDRSQTFRGRFSRYWILRNKDSTIKSSKDSFSPTYAEFPSYKSATASSKLPTLSLTNTGRL